MNSFSENITLYGDDFSPEEIIKWYKEEAEGYAELGNKDIKNYEYQYHNINKIYGYSKIERKKYDNVLGIGSAWGHEFKPIIPLIKNLHIIEPSDNMRSKSIGGIIPNYIKPNPLGTIPFNDNTFDIITCMHVLHHIPNVSYLLKEIIRVLKPQGYLLLNEPIVSMGDPSKPRYGLTKNERGIPIKFFLQIFAEENVEVVSKKYLFTGTSVLSKLFNKIFRKSIYSYKSYIYFDKILSFILQKNVRYHTSGILKKIAPTSIYFVIKKQ